MGSARPAAPGRAWRRAEPIRGCADAGPHHVPRPSGRGGRTAGRGFRDVGGTEGERMTQQHDEQVARVRPRGLRKGAVIAQSLDNK